MKMKKKILFTIVAFIFMFIGMSKVSAEGAITLTQADFTDAKNAPETTTSKGLWYHVDGPDKLYILPQNTNIILDGAINLDDGAGEIQLRNNNLTLNSNVSITGGIKTESSTNNTLSGAGTVSGEVKQFGGNMTINGSITFNKLFTSVNANTTIINGGTFNDGFMAKQNTDVTINNATINTGTSMSNAIQVDNYSKIVINNVTVTAYNVALASSDAGDVTIKGGTFTGGGAGLFIGGGTAKIYGGTFRTTSATNIDGKNGAIVIGSSYTFEGLLADTYRYSASTEYTTSTNYSLKFLNVREISVVTESASGTTDSNNTVTPTKLSNPKTGDNIILYIVLALIGITGLVGLGVYTKKKVFN